MNKFFLFGVFAFFGLIMLSFQANNDPKIEQARSWFQSHYQQPKYRNISVTPDWNFVRKVGRTPNHYYFEVPLTELIIADIGNFGTGPNMANEFLHANGYVKLIVEELFGEYVAYFIRVNGNRDFVSAKDRNAVQNTTFDKIDQNFGGSIEYIGMDGISIQGLLISNGVATGTVRTKSPTEKAEEGVVDRCWTCETITVVNWTVGGYVDGNGDMQWSAPHDFYTTFEIRCQTCPSVFGYESGLSVEQVSENLAWQTYYQTGYLPTGANTNIINTPTNCCEVPAMSLPGGVFDHYWVKINLNTQLYGIDCKVPSLSGHVSADIVHMVLPTNYELTTNVVFIQSYAPNPLGVCGHTVKIKAECDIIVQHIVVGGHYAFGATYHYEHLHEGVVLR